MLKKLSLLVILIPVSICAQEVVSSSGDYFSNGNGSIAFTVGELAIETITTGSNNVTQGFHQTNLGVLAVNEAEDQLAINVFPNPTAEVLQVSINDFVNKSYRLFDLTGRLLTHQSLEKTVNEINLTSYSKGLYLLTLYNENNQKIKTYRIIKN